MMYSYATTPVSFNFGFSDNIYSRAILYVPMGTKEAYKSTQSWKNFENIVEFDASAVQDIKAENADANVIGIYSVNGFAQPKSQKGMNILKMSDGTTKKIVK